MFKKNMGWLDRTVRFIVGVALIPTGLFLLGGWQGNLGQALSSLSWPWGQSW